MNFHQWKRREVISLLSGAGADHGDPVVFRPFLEQLRRLGYTEGQGVILDDVLQAAARS